MLIIDRHSVAQAEQIITVQLPISERDRQRMVIDVLDIRDQQNRSSNVKADMSSWKLWQEMDLRPLMNVLFPLLDDIEIVPWNTGPVVFKDHPPLGTTILDLWSAVYRKGDKTVPHQHKPATGAFVYYPQASGNSAPLQFPECTPRLQIHPKNNMLAIFPGYMIHQVPELTDDDERVVIAGNFVRTGVNDALISGNQVLTQEMVNE